MAVKMTAVDLAKAAGGRLTQGDPQRVIFGFAIDSRQVKTGDLFIPFRGEHANGHSYIEAACAAGAAGAFFETGSAPGAVPLSFPLIEVESSLRALQRLAAAHRRNFDLKVVAITGSSGKTTTKDFTAGVLSSAFRVLKTTGNLNNEIGLPLTVLQLQDDHQVAVLEMGMTAPGEIRELCSIARPSIGVITNIGEAHIELLGSVEAIAAAKGELLDYLGSGGVAVLNGDDPRLLDMGKRYPGKVYYYGFNQGDTKMLELSQQGEKTFFRVRFPDERKGWFESPLPGRESAANALAALTVGYILGLDLPALREGLHSSRPTAGRLQVLHAPTGERVIDDSYNANPDSVRAALRVLVSLGKGSTVAVLGDMLELGPVSAEAHRSVGRFAAASGISCLITVGELARLAAEEGARAGLETHACRDREEALAVLRNLPPAPGRCILVKGSRGMRMDLVVRELTGGGEGDGGEF